MSYVGRVIRQKRNIDDFMDMFYVILDRGYEAVANNATDRKMFNVIRKLVLNQELAPTDELTCLTCPIVRTVAERIKSTIRIDHYDRLVSKSYLKKSHCETFKDAKFIADVFQDTLIMNRLEVSEKYGVHESSVQRIRSRVINADKYGPQYIAARTILNDRGVLVSAHACVRSHTLVSKKKISEDITTHSEASVCVDYSQNTLKENLLELAKQSKTIEELIQNEEARNLFYTLISVLN